MSSESRTGKLIPQSIVAQRYLILKVAGRGGMSAIYLALDMRMDRRHVAIKEMSQQNLDDTERQEAIARFQQEAHLLGTLQHPNLPRIYDAFDSEGRSFLVMDYIDGKNLLQILQETARPLPVDQVLHYADQLCNVLAYLHAHNPPIIFRDLKPTNVIATREGQIYLIDFGIARFFKEGQPQDTIALGSPGYAPPEQHGSGQTSPRSDLYALGATLHCCLTNRDPYYAPERFSFAPMRQFNPQVPEELDLLVMRLLSLDETRRPASALEVKQALGQIRKQQSSAHIPAAPVLAAPSSAPTQYVQQSPPPLQATQPVERQDGPQEKLILRATSPVPVPPAYTSNPALPAYPQFSPAGPGPQTPQAPVSRHTHVWTPGFLSVFFLLLLITLGGCLLTFNIPNPYGPTNHAGLDHATEAGLVAVGLIVCFTMIVLTRSLMAALSVLLSAAALGVAGAAFLLQTLRDLQPSAQILVQAPINQLVSYGLLALGLVTLLWLFRLSFTWGDRCWIFLCSTAICACTFLQIQLLDSEPDKHFLLLGALIVGIQTMLLTGQIERQRR
ncbi:MAG TPA: protein kinase [Ktedonobacteraceae bacterium]|jgi:serine/threonine protein kinase